MPATDEVKADEGKKDAKVKDADKSKDAKPEELVCHCNFVSAPFLSQYNSQSDEDRQLKEDLEMLVTRLEVVTAFLIFPSCINVI